MSCEHYKDALIEAAASGAAPQGELRAHLEGCASCRSAFAEEQSLFAAIDSGLHVAVNAEVPASLVPRERVALGEVSTLRLRWVQPVVFVSASVVLALAVFLLVRPRHAMPENMAKQGPVVAPATVRPGTSGNPEKTSPGGSQIATMQVGHSDGEQNSTNLRAAASSIPEVLVPPDEREAFARFVAVLNEHSDVAAALVARVPQKDAVVTADPLRIPDIEIKPLEGTETETSNDASEKH
jgi:hypothetical protein